MANHGQQLVVGKLAEQIKAGRPKLSVQAAMLEVGYSPNSAKNSHQMIKSKGFQELLEQAGATDKKLTRVLNEGLDASKKTEKGSEPDYAIRHKYLETGLKLKNHLNPGETPPPVQTQNNFFVGETELSKAYAEQLKQKARDESTGESPKRISPSLGE